MACLVLIFYGFFLFKRPLNFGFLVLSKSLEEIMRVESHRKPMYQGQVLYFQKIPENATTCSIRE